MVVTTINWSHFKKEILTPQPLWVIILFKLVTNTCNLTFKTTTLSNNILLRKITVNSKSMKMKIVTFAREKEGKKTRIRPQKEWIFLTLPRPNVQIIRKICSKERFSTIKCSVLRIKIPKNHCWRQQLPGLKIIAQIEFQKVLTNVQLINWANKVSASWVFRVNLKTTTTQLVSWKFTMI